MSEWHREHPELTGTDADPWMRHESHRRAVESLELEARGRRGMAAAGYGSIEEAMEDSTHVCVNEDCGAVQRRSSSGRCRECQVGRLVEREP